MAERTTFGTVTIVVKDIAKNEIVAIEHCDFFEAAMCRHSLEEKYPYPEYDILEVVSESRAFIYAGMRTSSVRQIIEKKLEHGLATLEKPVSEKAKLLNKLKKAVSDKKWETVMDIGEVLLSKYPKDMIVAKEVAVSYALEESKLDEAIEIFLSILKEDPQNSEIHGLLAAAYAKAENWGAAAQSYEKQADLEENHIEACSKLSSAAFMYWRDENYGKAEEISLKALGIAEQSGDQVRIDFAKNSLAYYWAELGKELEKAKQWCLEILCIESKPDFLKEIESRTFETRDARTLDTLGRVLESMGSLFEALQVVSKADKLELGHPIVRENLIRIYQKLGEKIKI